MSVRLMPRVTELLATTVGTRTKWDRKNGRKLARKVYVARFFYLDEKGNKREKSKEFLRMKEAEDYIRELRKKYERSNGSEIGADKMTFNDLADYYEKHYAVAAEYAEDRKVSGLRSLKPVQGYIRTLRSRFGNVKLGKLSHSDLREFRAERLKTPVVRTEKISVTIAEKDRIGRKRTRVESRQKETPRKIASVNRELMSMRRMLNVAVAEGWIIRNPFNAGHSLINMSNEAIRTRTLSVEEEKRLLEVCECDERRHLKAIVICLLDTGLRFNEAITLTLGGVDLSSELIHIKAFNSKTAKPKTVPISKRLRGELERLRTEHQFLTGGDEDATGDLVFGIKSNVSGSWSTARKLAGIADLRLHDLRHTFGTRLDRSGFTQAQIARLLGHQQVHTTFRYTNPDGDLLLKVKRSLDSRDKTL